MWTILIVLLATTAGATCNKGCEEYHGTCACDTAPFQAVQTEFPSNEKPRKEQQREWETGAVKADMPQSLISQDSLMDQQAAAADREGKMAAGIPVGKPTQK